MSHALSTYEAARLQAAAYRNLRQTYARALAEFDLSPPEWALLGVLTGPTRTGIRLGELSEALGVEPPFVTTVVEKLRRRKLVDRLEEPDDRRVKRVVLTKFGVSFTSKVERVVRRRVERFMSDITPAEMRAYLAVLRKLARS